MVNSDGDRRNRSKARAVGGSEVDDIGTWNSSAGDTDHEADGLVDTARNTVAGQGSLEIVISR